MKCCIAYAASSSRRLACGNRQSKSNTKYVWELILIGWGEYESWSDHPSYPISGFNSNPMEIEDRMEGQPQAAKLNLWKEPEEVGVAALA